MSLQPVSTTTTMTAAAALVLNPEDVSSAAGEVLNPEDVSSVAAAATTATPFSVQAEPSMRCAIAQDRMQAGEEITLGCGHQFKKHYLSEWIRSGSNTCPNCRGFLTDNEKREALKVELRQPGNDRPQVGPAYSCVAALV